MKTFFQTLSYLLVSDRVAMLQQFNFIHIKITIMTSQLIKKAVFLVSLLIIIVTHSGCKKFTY